MTCETLQMDAMKSFMFVKGIVRNKNENCQELISKFMKETMEIKQEVLIIKACRVGKGNNAPIKFQLKNFHDKGIIFQAVKNLAGKTNRYNVPCAVEEQLPPRLREVKAHQHLCVAENKGRDPSRKLAIKFEKGDMLVNDQRYQKTVQPPKVRDYPSNS